MKKIVQLALLAFIVVAISACGKIGELEAVKTQQVTPTKTVQSSTIT
jgi:predicted small lipoprotein YifL